MYEVTIKRAGFDGIITTVKEGMTVKEVLEGKNIAFNGMEVRVNGSTSDINEVITGDTEIRILKKTAGA